MRRLLVTLALSALGVANAATVTVYTSLAAWQGAITGSAQVQGFDSYAAGDDLTGTQVLPGLTLSSNVGGNMQVFGANKIAAAFGNGRLDGNAQYDGTYALPFLAAALDIVSFEADPGVPTTAQDNGLMQFFFSDGSVQDIVVAGNPTGAAIFLGVVSDHAITGFRWHEAHEASGGNEETGLDNFRVAMSADANQVPLPGTLPLALLALGALPVAVRRRRG